MGGMTTVLSALPAVLGSVEAVASARNEKRGRAMDERQLAEAQRLQEGQAAASAALEREKLALDAKATEEERRAALKRAVARQRASFGSQGVGSAGGSAQAVLLGMFEESDAERARRSQLDDLRLRIIDEDVLQRRATNILDRQQLQERNRLDAVAASYRQMRKDISRLESVIN